MSRPDDKAFILEFIEVYHSLPALWDTKCKDYNNRDKKSEQYDVLIEKYRENFPNADRLEVTKKINSLRTNFRKELKRLRELDESGMNAEDIESTLWYFEEMKFLLSQETSSSCPSISSKRERTPDIVDRKRKIETDTQDIRTHFKGVKAQHGPPPLNKKYKKDDTTDALLKLACKRLQKSSDTYEKLASAWADEIKKMEPQQQVFVKKAVHDIIFEGQMGTLHRNSVEININNNARSSTPTGHQTDPFSQYSEVEECQKIAATFLEDNNFEVKSPQQHKSRRSSRMQPTSFAGKVVIITGASSDIGAATAVELAKQKADLVLVGRNAENLLNISNECGPLTDDPLMIVADMGKEEDIRSIVEKTVATYGRIDVLVNAASINECGSIESTNLEQYDRVMHTNVRSIYQLTTLATPELIKTKGNIVNISSVCGLRSSPGVLAYNMSKAALDQFTRCVALELASKGVRVNAVNPGALASDFHKRGGNAEEKYAEFLSRCKQTHALGRAGEQQEVAAAIRFLASDEASFITGVTLPVDGGRHAMCPR